MLLVQLCLHNYASSIQISLLWHLNPRTKDLNTFVHKTFDSTACLASVLWLPLYFLQMISHDLPFPFLVIFHKGIHNRVNIELGRVRTEVVFVAAFSNNKGSSKGQYYSVRNVIFISQQIILFCYLQQCFGGAEGGVSPQLLSF